MLQKIVIGFLGLTLIGAVGVGLSDAARPVEPTLDLGAAVETAVEEPADAALLEAAPADQAARTDPGSNLAAQSQTGQPQAGQQQATSMVGEPWHGAGDIVGIDANGFDLATGEVEPVYVELGQPSFWQAQGVSLAVGDFVTVDGFSNGEQIHAATVTTPAGVLAVRTADGQPLWSGGASGQGQNGAAAADGTATGEVQVAAEDWVTLEGTIATLDTANLTLQTATGEMVTFQLGQAAFWQGQGVTLAVGDELSVLGFWQVGQFQAGEIQKVATGERIMLRDPNGRPLWGGPGRAGNAAGGGSTAGGGNAAGGGNGGSGAGNGAGNGGNGGNGAGGAAAGSAGQGSTQGTGGQGGRQYRGGRS